MKVDRLRLHPVEQVAAGHGVQAWGSSWGRHWIGGTLLRAPNRKSPRIEVAVWGWLRMGAAAAVELVLLTI